MRETVVKPGEEIELNIEAINHQGQGVGRFKGMAVFVSAVVPGETVIARVTELKKSYALAQRVEILAASENRVQPRCQLFNTCGGSHLQHIEYGLQLELKRTLVEDSLKRIGKLTGVIVQPTIGMPDPWGYRNKATFQVNLADDKIKLGFFEEGSHDLVPAAQCLLLDRQIRDVANIVEGLLEKYRIPVYDWQTGSGLIRHVVIRKSWHSQKIMVVLVTSPEKSQELAALAREIRLLDPAIVSVVHNVNPGRGRQVFGSASQVLDGQNYITDQISELNFNISPTSFFQVNSLQTEVLYDKALEYAALIGTETVLDVYCGIGTISLFLAQKAGRVYGFEVSAEAVEDAAANARANHIANVEFIAGKAEERLPRLVSQGVHPDVVVVDPPRQGIEKRALQAIADMAPIRIVYISCDPGTMARDVSFLSNGGYKVEAVQPVDMFPQTSHVESIVLMTNSGLKGK